MNYTCPNCGRTFTLGYDACRVTCRKCGTSWNISYAKTYGKEVATFLMGAVISPVLPTIGGLMVLGRWVVRSINTKTKEKKHG